MSKKIIMLLALCIFLVGCQKEQIEDSTGNTKEEFVISNMSGEDSIAEVESALKEYLVSDNVENFINGVVDYNETIENTSLIEKFSNQELPAYDTAKIIDLWMTKKGEAMGSNCRINTFMLLKGNITLGETNMDDSMLFFDEEAIESQGIFNEEELNNFKKLFSRVKTDKTTDLLVHANKMEEHFKNVDFDDNAKMISVVIHDNLDGDYLFIGHVGVLVESKGEYIFLEKISFEEPFQAIKFKTKEDCFRYLSNKYKDYQDEGAVAPFIMENGKLAQY